jgi:hypothetical protein
MGVWAAGIEEGTVRVWTGFSVVLISLLMALAGSASGAVISVGTPFETPVPSNIPAPLPVGAFLVPVEITGAAGLQSWQFDLVFDNTVVEVIDHDPDISVGIYGAEFTPGDPNTLSEILAGFPLNALGLVSGAAGSYPLLLTGPTGDGVLAYVVFDFLPGQEAQTPGFAIQNAGVVEAVPEPGTLTLVGAGLTFLVAHRMRSRRSGASPS